MHVADDVAAVMMKCAVVGGGGGFDERACVQRCECAALVRTHVFEWVCVCERLLPGHLTPIISQIVVVVVCSVQS